MGKRFQFASMYDVIRSDGTACGNCGAIAELLTPRCMTKMPAFYIAACGFIGEVGCGPVRKCRNKKATP